MFDFSDSTKSVQSIFSIFLIICLVWAIGLELYKWNYIGQASGYLFYDTKSTFEAETFEQTNPHLMAVSRNQEMGQEFSYSFWLLIRTDIKDDDTDERPILLRGNTSVNRANPTLFLGGSSKTLSTMTIRAQTYPTVDSSGADINTLEAKIENLPIRRWVHIAACGKNNALDVFVNGRLAQHVEASQPLLVSTGPLYICQNGGFDGFISKLHYTNHYYTYDTLYSMMKSGPAPIPNLNSQYGTSGVGMQDGGGLPDSWWLQQKAEGVQTGTAS